MIAFYLASAIPVFAFSLLLALGVLAGLLWVARRAPARQATRLVNASLLVLLGALIGARAVHVVFYWPYFQEHGWESLLFFQGGLSWPGALAGGLLALGIYAAWSRQSLAILADALLPLLVALSVSAWLGCWLDGCAYGPLTSAWWGLPARDEWGSVTHRLPVQLLGATLTVGAFWLLERFSANARPGQLASLGWLSLSLIMFCLSFLRFDPSPLWRGLRLETLASLAFIGLALVAFLATRVKSVKNETDLSPRSN